MRKPREAPAPAPRPIVTTFGRRRSSDEDVDDDDDLQILEERRGQRQPASGKEQQRRQSEDDSNNNPFGDDSEIKAVVVTSTLFPRVKRTNNPDMISVTGYRGLLKNFSAPGPAPIVRPPGQGIKFQVGSGPPLPALNKYVPNLSVFCKLTIQNFNSF
jgi:hypothetical protein